MITVNYENDNPISQFIYENIINDIDFMSVTCPSCNHSGHLIKYGHYPRSLKTCDGTITLRILRVKCNLCGKTHAVLLVDIVPYSQIPLDDHLAIIQSDSSEDDSILDENPNLDISDIRYIRKQYNRYWKAKIISFRISFDYDLSISCFRYFKKQFMQIRSTINSLYLLPT